ncbi:hypothetical protein B0A55_07648, partial [Friedmanniomyces simplex]
MDSEVSPKELPSSPTTLDDATEVSLPRSHPKHLTAGTMADTPTARTWSSHATIGSEVSPKELPSSPTTLDDATEVSPPRSHHKRLTAGVEVVPTPATAREPSHDQGAPQPATDREASSLRARDVTRDRTMDDRNVDMNGAQSRRNIGKQKPAYRKDICDMMFVSGETGDVSQETTSMIENIVQQQVMEM